MKKILLTGAIALMALTLPACQVGDSKKLNLLDQKLVVLEAPPSEKSMRMKAEYVIADLKDQLKAKDKVIAIFREMNTLLTERTVKISRRVIAIENRLNVLESRQNDKMLTDELNARIGQLIPVKVSSEGGVPLMATDAKPSNVNYKGFRNVTKEVQEYRKKRLISVKQFNDMAKDKNTIILDTRSVANFKVWHVKDAVNLNFSEFTTGKLAKVIPDKNTRILIYCNNNFDDKIDFKLNKKIPTLLRAVQKNSDSKLVDMPTVLVRNNKEESLALNIPTFINLYGYGYKDIYELGSLVDVTKTELKFDGTYKDTLGPHPCANILVGTHEATKCKVCKDYREKIYAAPDWRNIPESSFICPKLKANSKPPHDRLNCRHCVLKLNAWGYKFKVPAK